MSTSAKLGREAGTVVAVSLSPAHGFSKEPRKSIRLLAGLGVEGDAHAGTTVQHLYRLKLDPTAPNLAQVHFLHEELFGEMAVQGYALSPGLMGENVLTQGPRSFGHADGCAVSDRRGADRDLRRP